MASPQSANSGMVEQLAKDYAVFAKTDFSSQAKDVHDTIEDMMTRLEEFESIVGMVQTEGAECMSGHLPRLGSIRPEILNFCKRIDALECVIARANVDLSNLETQITNAEAELGLSDRLFGMLNPLSFFKKPQEPVVAKPSSSFERPSIYKTEDFFNKE